MAIGVSAIYSLFLSEVAFVSFSLKNKMMMTMRMRMIMMMVMICKYRTTVYDLHRFVGSRAGIQLTISGPPSASTQWSWKDSTTSTSSTFVLTHDRRAELGARSPTWRASRSVSFTLSRILSDSTQRRDSSPIHTADADETKLSRSLVASASTVCIGSQRAW